MGDRRGRRGEEAEETREMGWGDEAIESCSVSVWGGGVMSEVDGWCPKLSEDVQSYPEVSKGDTRLGRRRRCARGVEEIRPLSHPLQLKGGR